MNLQVTSMVKLKMSSGCLEGEKRGSAEEQGCPNGTGLKSALRISKSFSIAHSLVRSWRCCKWSVHSDAWQIISSHISTELLPWEHYNVPSCCQWKWQISTRCTATSHLESWATFYLLISVNIAPTSIRRPSGLDVELHSLNRKRKLKP